jgi:hypothetical protein
MSKRQSYVGTYTGTGAAINNEIGFVPDYVEIWNYTDGDIMWKWNSQMADASAFQIDTAFSKITSNGVTPYQGARGSNKKGFTIGSSLSESAKVFHFIATRSDD